MRILVISQYFWPENFRINNIVEELISRDHEVTVLTGLPNYPSGSVFSEYKENPSGFLGYHGAKVVRVPLLPRGKGSIRLILNYISFFLMASTLGLWKLRKQKFDVVFVLARWLLMFVVVVDEERGHGRSGSSCRRRIHPTSAAQRSSGFPRAVLTSSERLPSPVRR